MEVVYGPKGTQPLLCQLYAQVGVGKAGAHLACSLAVVCAHTHMRHIYTHVNTHTHARTHTHTHVRALAAVP